MREWPSLTETKLQQKKHDNQWMLHLKREPKEESGKSNQKPFGTKMFLTTNISETYFSF